MDIVIRLPLNMRENAIKPEDSDIILEPREAGFVHLRMGTQYKNMWDKADWDINKAAYTWGDDKKDFLIGSKFMNWFKKVMDLALNSFKIGSTPIICSGGVEYTIRVSESGPSRTLFIENKSKAFKLDVDLVPALKFPEERWPINNSYRRIRDDWSNPEKYWLVVPKPNKNARTDHDGFRSWRLGMHVQERKLMYDTGNLRKALCLVSLSLLYIYSEWNFSLFAFPNSSKSI